MTWPPRSLPGDDAHFRRMRTSMDCMNGHNHVSFCMSWLFPNGLQDVLGAGWSPYARICASPQNRSDRASRWQSSALLPSCYSQDLFALRQQCVLDGHSKQFPSSQLPRSLTGESNAIQCSINQRFLREMIPCRVFNSRNG